MQTPHILIVEDEIVTRNTLKSIFEERVTWYMKPPTVQRCTMCCQTMISIWLSWTSTSRENGLLLAREPREQANGTDVPTGRDNEVDKITSVRKSVLMNYITAVLTRVN